MTTGTDSHIDPITGDYDGKAADELQNAVYLRMVTPLGSYWADPELGSLLYLLQREKNLPTAKLLAEQYTREALQPLLDSKRVDKIDIALFDVQEMGGTSRLPMQVSIYRHGQVVAQLTQHVTVMQA